MPQISTLSSPPILGGVGGGKNLHLIKKPFEELPFVQPPLTPPYQGGEHQSSPPVLGGVGGGKNLYLIKKPFEEPPIVQPPLAPSLSRRGTSKLPSCFRRGRGW